MVFSSLSFLYFFLPAALLCFRLAPPRIRSGVLLFFSLFFYAWGDLGNLPLMLLGALLHYGAGLAVFRLRRGSRLWKRRYCHRLRISRTLKNGG